MHSRQYTISFFISKSMSILRHSDISSNQCKFMFAILLQFLSCFCTNVYLLMLSVLWIYALYVNKSWKLKVGNIVTLNKWDRHYTFPIQKDTIVYLLFNSPDEHHACHHQSWLLQMVFAINRDPNTLILL